MVLQVVLTYCMQSLCNKERTGYRLITSTVTAVRSGADEGRRDAVTWSRGDVSSESSKSVGLRGARAARPLYSRWAVGSLETLCSRQRQQGRCRGACGYAVISIDGCGGRSDTLALETVRGVQPTVPCRQWHQGDRVVTDCAHECRYGCDFGTFAHAVWYVGAHCARY